MKTLKELYNEVIKNDELNKEFLEAGKNGKIQEFLKAHGCDVSAEEINTFFDEQTHADKALSLDELEGVAGGNLPLESEPIYVMALRTINAANGPGEVGDVLYGETLELVAQISAGTIFRVYSHTEENGYIYTNSNIGITTGSYRHFWVKLSDIQILGNKIM